MTERFVTPEGLKAKIKDTRYVRIDGTTLTLCILTLENGFSVRGESACVDPAHFNQEKGEKNAYEDAFRKLWPLEGYLLAEEIYQEQRLYEHSGGLFDFGTALRVLDKRGGKVQRVGWNGVGLWLELQKPDVNSKMTLPYIYINYPDSAKTTPGARVPWLASQTDMLAQDWREV